MERTEKRAVAKWLRANQTSAEHVLWRHLKSHRLGGVKFKRQKLVCGYIADFFCGRFKLVIEVDGGVHDTRQAYDARRTEHLAKRGWETIRFTNDQVFYDRQRVLDVIASRVGTKAPTVRSAVRRAVVVPLSVVAPVFNPAPRLVKRH